MTLLGIETASMFFLPCVSMSIEISPEGVWRAGLGPGHAQTELGLAQPVEDSL